MNLTPMGIISTRTFLRFVLLSCDIYGTYVRVSTVVCPNEDRPLESLGSITATRSYSLLKRKLIDETMGKEGTSSVVDFAYDDQPLTVDWLSQVLALACELGTHFARIVYPCEEHKRGPSPGVISSLDQGREPVMMLARVVIEEESSSVSGTHQMLDGG